MAVVCRHTKSNYCQQLAKQRLRKCDGGNPEGDLCAALAAIRACGPQV